MSFMSKMFRNVRRPHDAEYSLRKGMEASREGRNRKAAGKVGMLLGICTITVLAFQRGQHYAGTVGIGDAWQRETLVAPFDFPLYKSEDSLQMERNRIRFTTDPIFNKVPNALERMQDNHETVAGQLDDIFNGYKEFRHNVIMGSVAAASNDSAQLADFRRNAHEDSLRYVELKRSARIKLTDDQWQWLGSDYVARSPDLPGLSRELATGPPLYEVILDDVLRISAELNTRGVLSIPHDSVYTSDIRVRDISDSTVETVRKVDLFGLNEVFEAVQSNLEQKLEQELGLGNIPTKFAQAIFYPSFQYDHGATVRQWQNAERRISPTRGRVPEGQIIVREGEIVTPVVKQTLLSYEIEHHGQVSSPLPWKRMFAQIILAISTFAIFFLYLFMARRRIFDDNTKLLLMALLCASIIGLFAVAIRVDADWMFAVPVVMISVVMTVIFDSRVGLFGTLALALVGGMILGYNFGYVYATLFAGTLAVFSVRDIRNRSQVFLSAAFAFTGYLVAMGGTWMFLETSTAQLWSNLLMAGISSFLLIMAYPLLWVFERIFDVTTDLSLLELSDTNRPLLKELGLRAPGTFNHSLQVANLAEAAAGAIGANALLTRVGALYHDTGKMAQPNYFIENLRSSTNPHDQLMPHESAQIIKSHIEAGLELGQQHKLPGRVMDFIPMHHGTTRMEYFYHKAISRRDKGDPVIREDAFRYNGPRPQSKETAILMLADSIESASRTLDEPTPENIQVLIDNIVEARINDGQLDEAPMTFRDLTKIKATFQSLLSSIYHLRVKYPGQLEK